MQNRGFVSQWFLDRGFGFIQYELGSLFVHFRSVKNCPEKFLPEGTEVFFDIGSSRDGRPCAVNVRRVQDGQ